jgi:hypothetical protein
MRTWAEKYDYVVNSGSMMPTQDGLVLKDVLMLGVRCEVVQDRLRSLQKSFDRARKQLSGTRPAVIHIDVTSALPTFEYAEAEYRQKIIDETSCAITPRYPHWCWSMTTLKSPRRRLLQPDVSKFGGTGGARFPMPAALRARLEEQRVDL